MKKPYYLIRKEYISDKWYVAYFDYEDAYFKDEWLHNDGKIKSNRPEDFNTIWFNSRQEAELMVKKVTNNKIYLGGE